jgi:hypothetical protein
MDERRRALFSGAYKLKDSLLVMLDPERLDPMRLGAAQAAQDVRASTLFGESMLGAPKAATLKC